MSSSKPPATTTPVKPNQAKPSLAQPSYLPTRWVSLSVLACLLAIAFLRSQHENVRHVLFDEAFLNIATLILSFIALMNLFVWFVWRSAYPSRYRSVVMWGAVMTVVFLMGAVKIEGVTGNMLLKLRWRWNPATDTQLKKLDLQPLATVYLAPTSPTDFPQFLGPDRSNYLPGPALATDWAANPPKLVWRQKVGAGWSAFVSVNGYAVTMEQRGPEEWTTCYEVATGKPVWGFAVTARHENTLGGIGPRSTPTIHNGNVYSLGATGVLNCLEGSTGKLLWQKDLLKEQNLTPAQDEQAVAWGRSASPLIVDNTVVVPLGGPKGKTVSLVAYDLLTGKEVWRGGQQQISYASPMLLTLLGVQQIVSVNESTITGHNPQTGEQLWSHPWPGQSASTASSSQTHQLSDSDLLVSKSYGVGSEVLRLTKTDGPEAATVWKAETIHKSPKVMLTKYTNLTIIDDYAYTLSDGILECVKLPELQRRWKVSQGRFGHGQVLGVGKLILVQTEETGEVVLVKANPEKLEILGRFQALEGRSWNNLCLIGKRLLVRGEDEAACYDLP